MPGCFPGAMHAPGVERYIKRSLGIDSASQRPLWCLTLFMIYSVATAIVADGFSDSANTGAMGGTIRLHAGQVSACRHCIRIHIKIR